ncbi:hypothetical protein Amn_01970 [Aminobacter sp. Y103A]|nr:hypothetical protein Amn_01970 [Aminobacter sp. SS-2016]
MRMRATYNTDTPRTLRKHKLKSTNTLVRPPQKPQSTREINNLIHITTRNRQTNLDSIAPEKPPPGQNKPHNARSKDDSEPIHTANPH